jgi:uncharacterized ion transporter superfamily protein YfcC
MIESRHKLVLVILVLILAWMIFTLSV